MAPHHRALLVALAGASLGGCSLLLFRDDFTNGAAGSSQDGSVETDGGAPDADDASRAPSGPDPDRYLFWAGGFERVDGGEAFRGTVLQARILADGALAGWTSAASVPNEDTRVASVSADGADVFVLVQSDIFRATMRGGQLSSFARAATLPVLTSVTVGGSLHVANHVLYVVALDGSEMDVAPIVDGVIGAFRHVIVGNPPRVPLSPSFGAGGGVGLAASSAYDLVFDDGGTPLRWERASAPLLAAASVATGDRSPAVIANGFVYQIGRVDQAGGGAETYFAERGAAGVGSWRPTRGYPERRLDFSCVADNGFLYVVGGRFASVGVAKIAPNGELEAWRTTVPMPIVFRGSHNATVVTSR